MSHQANTQLLERAKEMQEYWAGTQWERLIQYDLDNDDLEALSHHVALAGAEASQQEFMKGIADVD